jgi:hypothetical protein
MATQIGIVIRADGTVPFDDEVQEEHKHAMLGYLLEQGHAVAKQDDGSWKIANFDPNAVK